MRCGQPAPASRIERRAVADVERDRSVRQARRLYERSGPLRDSPGAAYLERRAVPLPIAFGADVRDLLFEHRELVGDEWRTLGYSHRVLFPFVDRTCRIVRVQLRAIDVNHLGRKVEARGSGGAFATRPIADVLRARRIAIVEAPIDALSLATVGLDALAVGGSYVPEWLVDALASKDVLIAFDNDEPDRLGRRAGDAAAERLAEQLWDVGAEAVRCRPSLKDWNDVLCARGREGVWLELPC